MKNSKEYSGKVKKLFRAWKRQAGDLSPVSFDEPLEAVVAALVSEHRQDGDTRRVIKRIHSHFVDLNDLRVSRSEEILDVMGDHSETAQATAQRLTKILNQVYDRYDVMSLAVLKGTGKRQGRKELEELDGMSRYAVDYCFVTSLGGHAIPLTESMKALLRREALVFPEATEEEIHGFLERQISAADGWAFYCLLRAAAEGALAAPAETDDGDAEKKPIRKSKKKTGGTAVRKKKTTKTARKTVRKK